MTNTIKAKETRKIYSDDLRNLCIARNWYTIGTCKDYMKLLNTVDALKNVTTRNIVGIAQDIIENSDMSGYECQYSDKEIIESVCFDIAKISNVFFEMQ